MLKDINDTENRDGLEAGGSILGNYSGAVCKPIFTVPG